jgi:hypothetical protein
MFAIFVLGATSSPSFEHGQRFPGRPRSFDGTEQKTKREEKEMQFFRGQ